MTCRDLRDRVEAIAAGDFQVDGALREHFEACPGCAAALADARRIESLLAARPAPEPPARFAASVQHRIRAERWRADQRVDRIFNLAIAGAAVLVVVAGVFLLRGGLIFDGAPIVMAMIARMGTQAMDLAAPAIGTYVAATGLLVSGLIMWWWAEG